MNIKATLNIIHFRHEMKLNDDKELIILNPFRIIRNSDGSVKENRPMGKGILFVNSDIKHLVSWKRNQSKEKYCQPKITS